MREAARATDIGQSMTLLIEVLIDIRDVLTEIALAPPPVSREGGRR